MDQLKAAIDNIGLTVLANSLSVSPQRLCNWVERGVPLEFCAALEIASGGIFQRKKYRADWATVWPELADKATV